jgi:hypothetical protein
MKNHDILFDREHQRVAFVRANCVRQGIPTWPEVVEGPDPTPEQNEEPVPITDGNKTIEDEVEE